MLKKYDWYVGIDCGVSTGVAIWSRHQKIFTKILTIKIHKAWELVIDLDMNNPGDILIRVEDARQATWMRKGDVHKAQGAGSVMRDASIWEGILEDLGIDYEMVRPRKEFTKWKEDAFKSLTKFEGRTSEHARDAALLVYGL